MAALMIQGCGSDVGKSVLVAGLCRLFTNRGLTVRPFKSQNMSNNAAVTRGGGEIGRAQALQALACRTPATVDMNPILLKPQSDVGAQLIVRGKMAGTLDASAHGRDKSALLDIAVESYRRLAREADLVIVEGAGSPAETNLRQHDIANMGLAQALGLPVILVGDINRGHVIAALVGAHVVLDAADRALIRGFIVNKFRGDPKLFEDGVRRVLEHTGWPSMGVVPWLAAASRLPSEDGMQLEAIKAPEIRAEAIRVEAVRSEEIDSRAIGSEAMRATAIPAEVVPSEAMRGTATPAKAGALEQRRRTRSPRPRVRIAVPQLSRLANFDDFDPLRAEPQIELLFVPPGKPIPRDAALIILPGTKSTIADMEFMRAQGWDIDVLAHVRHGGRVLGICGGYQMLGRSLSDPKGIEGPPRTISGLGLLDVETVMTGEKTLREVSGTLLGIESGAGDVGAGAVGAIGAGAAGLGVAGAAGVGAAGAGAAGAGAVGAGAVGVGAVGAGVRFRGYEMHVGVTTGPATSRHYLKFDDGTLAGAISADGRVAGCYVHGLFEMTAARSALVESLGVAPSGLDHASVVNAALDEIAAELERCLDIEALAAIAGL